MSDRPRILFLYTEIAPYFLACAYQLAKDHGLEVHVVRWPVNKEAPFDMDRHPGVVLHDRRSLDDDSPDAIGQRPFSDGPCSPAAGWIKAI